MFYDLFEKLCDKKGVSPNRACTEMGFERTISAKWKANGTMPRSSALPVIAEYFGVSVEYLLAGDKAEELAKESSEPISDPDIRLIARAGKNMTPAQRTTVLKYMQFTFPEAFEGLDKE